ncbi:MAG: hypothetical protein H0U18_09970 [Pyrinomonadaceae bacterium]|nr:hypothetical protein [Pyrinomonadaceae bacterium]
MATSDATVDVSLRAAKTPVMGADWFIEPFSDNEFDLDIAEFVEFNLLSGTGAPFLLILEDILRMYEFGFSVIEKVYEEREWSPRRTGANRRKYTMLRKLAPRPTPTIKEIVYDDNGGPVSIKQGAVQADGKPVDVEIPIEKLIIFSNNKKGGNLEGKALDPDTTIPTPDGFKRLDDIQIGDVVYDENGEIQKVIARQEWKDRPIFDILFSTGETIRCDAAHEWAILYGIQKKPFVLSTSEMFGAEKRDTGLCNFSIKQSKALWYPKTEQLVDPYILGQWLGDGTALTAEITSGDSEFQKLIEEAGSTIGSVSVKPRELARTYIIQGLATKLRVMNLKSNKHIPQNYIRASYDQRLALVQGLMDSDGHVDRWGRCEFVNTNEDIIDGFIKVVRSLGTKVRIYRKPPNPSQGRKKWTTRVHFVPGFPAFRLTRKLERQREAEKSKKCTHPHHQIKEISFVGTGRTICLEVSGESHLFLCGESLLPTCNSLLRTAYRPWYFKTNLYNIDGIQKERHGMGFPVVELPPGAKDADIAAAHEMVTNIRTNEFGGVALPARWVLKFLDLPGQPVDVMRSIEHHNGAIMLNTMTQFMLLGLEGTGGGRATSGSHQDMFNKSLRYVANLIADDFNLYCIPYLVGYNFDTDHFPKLRARNIGETKDLQQWASAVSNLFAQNGLTPDIETEQWIRTIIDAPLKRGGVQTPILPGAVITDQKGNVTAENDGNSGAATDNAEG